MKKPIIRWLKIHEEEIELFIWMALLLLFIRSSNIILNNFVETAFLKRFGVQYLPLITAVNALVTFFVFSFLGTTLSRVRGDRMMSRSLLACGLVVGLLRLAIPLNLTLLYPLLYVLKTQLDVLLTFIFWNLANDLFSTRQSKRLFPLITAGGIIGGIATSFLTPLIAQLISFDNLLLVFPLFALAGAATAWRLGRAAPTRALQTQGKEEPEKSSARQGFRKVGRLIKGSTLAQVLLLLTLLPNIVIPVINYQFSFVVDQTFASEAGMLRFYSYFRGAQGTISLILILFVGRIYGRFGLPVALMFHPLNYLLAFLAYLFQFNIFSAVYAGTSVGVIRRTINGPANAALYGLLRPKDRAILRPFLRGTVVRIGILTGSAIVWFGNDIMHPRYLSLIVIGFVIAWLAGTLLLKRDYSRILLNLIRDKLPTFYQMNKKDLQDLFRGVDIAPALLEQFRRSTGDEAIWHAEILRSNRVDQLDAAILEKLPALDDATRIGLLPFISNRAGEEAMDLFIKLADPARPELLVALAQTTKRMAAKIRPETEAAIFAATTDPEAKACFLGWMREQDHEGLHLLIDRWLASEKLPERRAAVLAIREQEQLEYADRICHLLETEKDPSLLCLALLALPVLEVEDLLRRVVPFLRHPIEDVRLAAVEALPLQAKDEIKALTPILGDPADSVRRRVIQRLGTTARSLQPQLVAVMGTGSRRVRDGLFQVAQRLEIEEVDLARFSNDQLKIACRVQDQAEWLKAMPATPSQKLLLIHLEEVRRERVENVVRGLAARDKSGEIETILHGLQSGGSREHGDSVEALEALVDQRLARILLPQLENESPAVRLAAGQRHLSRLQLANDPKQALKMLLLDENEVSAILTLEFLLETGSIDEFRSQIENLAASGTELVAGMALGILHETKEDEVNREMDRTGLPERMLHLRKIDLFQDLAVNELTAIALLADETRFLPDALIIGCDMACRSGAGSCECLHILISGEVVVETVNGQGAVPVAHWTTGQSFGLAALFGIQMSTLNVRAVKESVVMRIYRRDFTALIKEYPEIALRMCEVLAGRLGGIADELNRVTQEHLSAGRCPATTDCATNGTVRKEEDGTTG